MLSSPCVCLVCVSDIQDVIYGNVPVFNREVSVALIWYGRKILMRNFLLMWLLCDLLPTPALYLNCKHCMCFK